MMVNLRRAIVWSSLGQYFVIAVNFAALLVMARLLAPAEYGVAVLGGAILAGAEAIREVAGGSFLVRERELTPEKVRSMTTMSVLVTMAVAAGLVLAAEPLSGFFGLAQLAQYLRVSVLGYLLGPFVYAQMALFSRELQFNRLSVVTFLQALVGAGLSVLLAHMGFSSLSFAWAGMASAVTGAALCLLVGRDLSIYRPSLSHWRDVVGFGAYSSATAILGRIGETLPVLIFGKFLSPDALAIGHRAVLLCLVPERIVLAAVGPVALPEFSRRARAGEDLKQAYLTAVSHVSVVQWPAMIVLAVLAEPVVLLVLGVQWLDAVPLLRILSPALLFSVPIGLQYAALVAIDAVDRLPRLLMLQTAVTAAALLIAAPYGLHAAAWSMFAVLPINAALSLIAVRGAIAFRWRDLCADAARNAFVCLIAAAGPVAIAWANPSPRMSVISTAIAVLLGGAGWLFGLYVSSHPFWAELCRAAATVLRWLAGRHLRPGR